MEDKLQNVEFAIKMEVLEIRERIEADPCLYKVDLGIGAYRTDDGTPWLLPIVHRVEKDLVSDSQHNHEYIWFVGIQELSQAATELLLSPDCLAVQEHRAIGVQSVSGTGGIRVGAEFLKRVLGFNTFYLSRPTWDNHFKVFTHAGFTDGSEYRYWDAANRCLDQKGLLDDLRAAPEGAVVVLQACAHNPTGCDPTRDQWALIADVMQEKKLFPFFDIAYQGFASGDLDNDAWAVRYFADRGFELMCSQSFAKNMGLYGERVGNLTAVLRNRSDVAKYLSHMQIIIRAMYCSPPAYGAKVAAKILNTPRYFEEWKDNIKEMTVRIKAMREGLRERLVKLGTPGNWDHLVSQVGMFSILGLKTHQVEYISNKHHVYMMRSGRVNMCGLTTRNIDHVARAIHDTVTHCREGDAVML